MDSRGKQQKFNSRGSESDNSIHPQYGGGNPGGDGGREEGDCHFDNQAGHCCSPYYHNQYNDPPVVCNPSKWHQYCQCWRDHYEDNHTYFDLSSGVYYCSSNWTSNAPHCLSTQQCNEQHWMVNCDCQVAATGNESGSTGNCTEYVCHNCYGHSDDYYQDGDWGHGPWYLPAWYRDECIPPFDFSNCQPPTETGTTEPPSRDFIWDPGSMHYFSAPGSGGMKRLPKSRTRTSRKGNVVKGFKRPKGRF
jgi:hypothetical protein